MTNWIIAAGYSISGAMLIMMMIGIAFSAFMPSLDRWNRKYFVTFFSILLMYAVVLLIDLIIYTNPGIVAEQRVIIIIEYLFFSVLMPMPMPFLLHCCGESPKKQCAATHCNNAVGHILHNTVCLSVYRCILLHCTG